MGLPYRLGQFARLLRPAELSPEQEADVAQVLSAAEVALFQRLVASDRWHSYEVYRLLLDAGETDANLLAAALLHDIGKTRARPGILGRVAVVLAEKWLPRRAAAWSEGEPSGWRRPFVIRARHPEWGAALAQAAGSPPETVALIRQHQDANAKRPDRLLERLQWADDRR
jgi:putative nucleotidyltransferase with HDIG domain